MDIAGLTKTLNTKLTDDDRAGVRRAKPLSTSLSDANSTGLRRTKSLNTSLAGTKPEIRTQLTPQDLSGRQEKHSTLSQHDKLVKQAQTWVGQTFFGTLMKQMRESPFKSDLFSGGRGGEAFGAMYDQRLSERMSRGAGSHLVNSIVHRLEARAVEVRQQVAAGKKDA